MKKLQSPSIRRWWARPSALGGVITVVAFASLRCSHAFVLCKDPSNRPLLFLRDDGFGRIQSQRPQRLLSSSESRMNAFVAEEGRGNRVVTVTDKNGNEISEGSIVRVSKATKAYQVPASAKGSFNDDNKEFIAAKDSKYLIVPEGMCGVVTKVYVQANLSANFKVQVKFTPGVDCNKDGFDPPVPFLMHFAGKEIESVS